MEQISTILKGLVLPAILCGFVLCNLLCALFHLFYRFGLMVYLGLHTK